MTERDLQVALHALDAFRKGEHRPDWAADAADLEKRLSDELLLRRIAWGDHR